MDKSVEMVLLMLDRIQEFLNTARYHGIELSFPNHVWGFNSVNPNPGENEWRKLVAMAYAMSEQVLNVPEIQGQWHCVEEQVIRALDDAVAVSKPTGWECELFANLKRRHEDQV